MRQAAPPVQQQACISNQVRLASGQCGCPSNRPRWSKGKCKKPKKSTQDKINNFLKQQQQQPQNQPQQQPQNQFTPKQQQQIQQGINQLNKLFSDIRLKRDVEYLTTLESGIRLYSFRYLWDEQVQIGVMAQDLLRDPARRDAVSLHQNGYYMVDYGQLGLKMVTLDEWQTRGLEAALAFHIASPAAARIRP